MHSISDSDPTTVSTSLHLHLPRLLRLSSSPISTFTPVYTNLFFGWRFTATRLIDTRGNFLSLFSASCPILPTLVFWRKTKAPSGVELSFRPDWEASSFTSRSLGLRFAICGLRFAVYCPPTFYSLFPVSCFHFTFTSTITITIVSILVGRSVLWLMSSVKRNECVVQKKR